MAGTGGDERRRSSWSLESFTVDEVINLLQFKLHTRGGRRFLIAAGITLAVVIAIIPIMRRSGAHPTDALSNRPTAPITLPVTTSTASLTPGSLVLPLGGGDRIGPPLTTVPPATTAPRVTAPPATAAPVTAPPATAAPVTAPPATPAPTTAPPATDPGPPDTGIPVPVG